MSPQQPGNGSSADSPFGDERLARIAAGLAEQFALLYEAEPVDPRVHMAGNMLTFAFQGGLSISDQKHLEAGHLDELRAFRERFLEVVSGRLTSVVETLSGGQVTFSSGVFDPGSRTTNMLFVLDLLPDDAEEQRAAIRNWSEQVRRNARRLREQHRATREVHLALKEQMRRKREEVREDAEADAVRRSEDP